MIRIGDILNQDIHIRVLRGIVPLFQLLSQICLCCYDIVLKEEQCFRNTLNLAFDCPWKAGTYVELAQIVFEELL